MPPKNKNFTGREDLLTRLREGITGGKGGQVTAVVPHALHGLGGVGKTQLAVEYAYRYRSDYDLVWWVPAEQPGLARSTLAQLALEAPDLGVPDPATRGIEEAADRVLNALRRGEPYDRWLLIFDNADEPEEINDIVPRGGPGHVLVTSRNHRWESVVETLPVDVFAREESVAFLLRRVRRGLTGQDADRLAEALGDLPLALEQAGALQAETGMSVEEYLRLLEEHTGQVLDEGKPSEYPLSMTAAWALSVSSLRRRRPEAMELLRCCAFFGPEPIPRGVFARTDDPAVRPELRALLSAPLGLSRAISELGRYALVRIDDNRNIQVHRLIQALLREELGEEEQARMRAEVHALLAAYAPKDPSDAGEWPTYSELLAHLLPSRVVESRVPEVREFALATLNYLSASGNFRSANRYVDTMIRTWTRDATGPPELDVLRARHVQGNLRREIGQYEDAYQLDVSTLEQLNETVGPEHEFTLILHNSIGADLRARGDFVTAREHDERSLELHRRALGEANLRTLRAMNSLALDHGLTSDYRRSKELHEEAYERLLELADIPPVTRVIFWSGLARAVRLCGDYISAGDVGTDAYSFARQLGVDHPWTLRTARDLAIARLRAGEVEDALELARDVHGRCVRQFGLDNPDTLAAAVNLSNIQRTMGQTQDALTLVRDTMERYPRMYGEQHPFHHGCASNVAVLHRVLGDPETARGLNERSLAGLEAKLSRDHHYTLTVAVNLASDLAALGELESAVRLGRGTLRRLRALLGEDHPTTLAGAANLSADLLASGLKEEAEALRADTLDRYARTLTLDHRDAEVFLEGRHLDCDFDPPPI
ncbi:FxSxx-COOH system tetratricopeptide repeat protein [Actinomadura kijaniata]|uniref:FxSxx-COOH system tetratricopeptide repeat protein n=1 Tax=Actinomadura kijaniata TaxID=46161 RepID=UPI003F1D7B16